MNLFHKSHRPSVLVALAVLMLAAPGVSRAQVSLYTVVDLAQRNSTAVRLADADVSKAMAVMAETRDVFVPGMSFGSGLPALPSVGFTGNPPSIVNATVSSLVFSLPQRQYMLAARDGFKSATLALRGAREQVALDASIAYIELDTVNHELDAVHQQEEFSDRLVKIEQERTEAGVDPLSDQLQARLTAAQLKLKRLHLESRASTLSKQISTLTGLPTGSITPDRSSIPEIPAVKANEGQNTTSEIEAARMIARSKALAAKGDRQYVFLPQISFAAEYSRDTKLLNNADSYYAHPLKPDNFSSGFAIQVPLFDLGHRAKARESAADALRSEVEAEQAQRRNDIEIASLTSSLRELDALAEIASLKQQIAAEQLQTVLAQLELGNGAGTAPGATPQLSPKAEQLARIDERQKLLDSLDAGFDLSKARLSLLRALGHIEDWINELHAK